MENMEILIGTVCTVVLAAVISAVVYSLGRRRREEKEARLFFGALPDEKPEFDSVNALYNERLKSEHISEGKVLFDYTIKSGPADSRNAILLMAQMGFGEKITARARELCTK